MDYHLQEQIEHVQASDLTLVIPHIAFLELRNTFGVKVQALPQMAWRKTQPAHLKEDRELSAIRRPRLGYLGDLSGRVAIELVRAVLRRHPDWQFISFGTKKPGALTNEHVLPWRPQPELRAIIPELDIGFMPYDCANPKNFHCVPLKCFDYFDEGIPVVSTPISYLRQYTDLVYLGGSPEELESAIFQALAEPTYSAQRVKRRSIAQQHSIETVSHLIERVIEQHIR